ENQKSMRQVVSPGLTQLQRNPKRSEISGHVEVQNPASLVIDQEEAVENAEGECWYGEEVHRSNRFTVIAKKHQPALGWIRVLTCALNPPRDSSLRHSEAQLQQFSMNVRCSPSGILGDHAEDQIA